MSELAASWHTVGAWLARSVAERLPARVLKRFWTADQLLGKIVLYHFNQAPQFQVRSHNLTPELSMGGFNVINYSPFAFSIVGLELRMSVGSRELFEYALRLPSKISVQRTSGSGFYYKWPLSGPALIYVQQYPRDDLAIRVQGYMLIDTVFGELKKGVHADVLADIDRDAHPMLALPTTAS